MNQRIGCKSYHGKAESSEAECIFIMHTETQIECQKGNEQRQRIRSHADAKTQILIPGDCFRGSEGRRISKSAVVVGIITDG